MTVAKARHYPKMLAACVANEELELQCYQNKLARTFISNLGVQQWSQITFFTEAVVRIIMHLNNSKHKKSGILTTFAAFPR